MKSILKILRGILVGTLFCVMFSSRAQAMKVAAINLPTTLIFTPVVSGLTQPVFVTNAGDGSNRLFIVQQNGQIRIFKNGTLLPTPFINIAGLISNFTGTNGEQGLLGLAFDPNYSNNGNFYITYTTLNNDPTFTYAITLARFHVSSVNSDQADPSSGMVLLSIPKKYTNHNGGMIAFGPDGYLYMSAGDGGSGGDPDNNAQNLHTLLGKILRLDVVTAPPSGKTYVIPPTNPFYGNADPNLRQEIWAYGLRNPWRFSFDRSTGDLYIGDVGQGTEEEVDFQSSSSAGGQNYGWRILEGNLCYNPSINCVAPSGYIPPVATYDHGTNSSYGCSITGGYVYRGNLSPSLQGVYFYGDYCSGKVLGLIKNPDNTWTYGLIASTSYSISSFGQDEQGELYLADYGGGKLYHISSGSVIISGDAGAGGIRLSYTDGAPKITTSQADGSYSIIIPYGWSGTITPSRSCYTFNPPTRSYSNVTDNQMNQNYTYTVTPGCVPGVGIYDDVDPGWNYTGSWASANGFGGAYNSSLHYTAIVGDAATFMFSGTQFKLTYTQDTNRGNIDVYVNGNKIATINANGTFVWQKIYTSPIFLAGTHVVQFKHAGGGTYIDIDALQILNSPAPGAGTYDDIDGNWAYTGTWASGSGFSGAQDGTLHYTAASGDTATFVFSGTQFILSYTQDVNRGDIGVYVDGSLVTTIHAAGTFQWQEVYISPVYTSGTHTVQLKHAGGGTYIDVDAIQILDGPKRSE